MLIDLCVIERVVVIEPAAASADALRPGLHALGIRDVDIVCGPDAALVSAHRVRPQMMFAAGCPGLDAAFIELVQQDLDIPVVFVADRVDAAAVTQTAACNPRGWVLRPFRDGDLAIAVRMALRKHRVERRLRHHEMRAAELEQAAERLRSGQRLQAIGQLAGGIAHDFNNLLTVINGYADDLIAREGWDPQTRRMLTGIRHAAGRSSALAEQLLAYCRQRDERATSSDPEALVNALSDMLRRMIGEDVTLITRLERGAGAVPIERGRFEQIVMNLVVNARDAMPNGGRLVIDSRRVTFDDETASPKTLRPGTYLQFSVADCGTGIDRAIVDRIFDPFFTTKPDGKGTGLGLATVHDIVREAGGEVLVYTAPGRGSVFKIFLPVVDEVGAAAPATPEPLIQAPSAPRATVMLVEDDADVREYLAATLAAFGYRVVSAGDAEEALRVFDGIGTVDVLVTDMVMPGANGAELARRIRERSPEIRVLVLSGYPASPQIDGYAFLQKPFTGHSLGLALQQLLSNYCPPVSTSPIGAGVKHNTRMSMAKAATTRRGVSSGSSSYRVGG